MATADAVRTDAAAPRGMRLFDAAAVRAALPMAALIDALHAAFARGCTVPPRHVHAVGRGASAGTVLIMPAWREGARLGIKTINVFPGNAARGLPGLHGVYTLFDATTGVPLAQLDGSELTNRRTVAASALAARMLARADARRLLVVGAGRLARVLPEAMRAVRPSIDRVQVWARRPEAAAALCAELRADGMAAEPVADLEAAVRAADIVSCMTLAEAPLVRGAWLAPGAHLDLIGGFTPAMREADGECLRRARVWIDTPEALAKAGDLLQAAAEGAFAPERVQGTLESLCRGAAPVRASADEITLFKSVGNALEDLAAAELAVDGAP